MYEQMSQKNPGSRYRPGLIIYNAQALRPKSRPAAAIRHGYRKIRGDLEKTRCLRNRTTHRLFSTASHLFQKKAANGKNPPPHRPD